MQNKLYNCLIFKKSVIFIGLTNVSVEVLNNTIKRSADKKPRIYPKFKTKDINVNNIRQRPNEAVERPESQYNIKNQ